MLRYDVMSYVIIHASNLKWCKHFNERIRPVTDLGPRLYVRRMAFWEASFD